MMDLQKIKELIPHRPPFLWIDEIISLDSDSVETSKVIPKDLPLFEGHYPGNPIMPGVILCEAVFQSGALLMSHMMNSADSSGSGTPVLTRIENAKFKQIVRPGDTITIKVTLQETVSSVSFLKGKVFVNDKTAVIVSFACAIT